MQIVISISDHLYKCLQKRIELNTFSEVDQIIANGTPLPEHHGRLIDADVLEKEMIIAEGKAEGSCDYYMADVIETAKEYIIDAETIIPATKEGEKV